MEPRRGERERGRKMAAGTGRRSAEPPLFGPNGAPDPIKSLYPMVNEEETPLPRCWSSKDKYSFIGLSQNNLRVHYKGEMANLLPFVYLGLLPLAPRPDVQWRRAWCRWIEGGSEYIIGGGEDLWRGCKGRQRRLKMRVTSFVWG